MRTQSRDTHPKAEAVQIELLRRAGLSKRLALAFSLSRTTIALSREAIRKRRPDLSEQDLRLEFVALCYGEALARRVAARLERQRNQGAS